MTASCPAPECNYVGAMEAVCGHIGGSTDPIHSGLDATAVAEGARSRGIEIVVIGAILYAVYSGSSLDETAESGSSGSSTDNVTRERPSEGAYEGVYSV